MKYESLVKIHHISSKRHEDLYHKRFNAPETKHFEFPIREYNRRNSYSAFFCYTEELMLMLEKIYKKHEFLLRSLSRMPKLFLNQFVLSCVVDEVRATSDIEGVHSTRREIKEVVEGTAHSPRFSSIVGKYKTLINFKQTAFMTCEDVRRFYDEFAHKEVVADNPEHRLDGDLFRRDSVEITSSTGKIIHRGVIPEAKIKELLTVALQVLNDEDIPLLVRVAVFHYFFEYIHPFYDGNGRTARFIVSYFLAEHFHRLIALRLSVVIKKRKKFYYNLFSETDSEWNRGDLTPFVLGFTEIVSATFDDIFAVLDRKLMQLEMYRKKLSLLVKGDALTREIYDLLLQSTVFFAQGVSMDDLTFLTKKSRNTVKARLDLLPENHVFKSSTKKIFYRLNMMLFKNV